jgi:eukaryotic-like serine/threonine-protein kinase
VETAEAWTRIKRVFTAALEQRPEKRDAFLNEACGSDLSLRTEVESLLKAHDETDQGFDNPWPPRPLEAAQPRSIGPYQLLSKIGEGGMGQVWLGQQTSPLQRRVAVKLIRWGIYDDALLYRFQSERQSLAAMDHPSIAKVFDAGTTPEGQPYFVMEYVAGTAITGYCDGKKLSVAQRLELFIRVCEGVQHAHQKAIIHRDLKPENILVTEVDGKPVPRIIDFGLAKPLGASLSGESTYTRAGTFLGTPGYMSPEQSDSMAQDVDTRADVYSLGVVLYVMLTGVLPFDSRAWMDKPVYDLLHKLHEQDPPRPSTRVVTDRAILTAAAEARSIEPKQLINLLRGDLDWIVMKAVEKDRNRRYGTPLELAEDITRYLAHQPVKARPASISYRLRKYIRRNLIVLGVGAVITALLAGFAIAQSMQLRKTIRERDRADRIADLMTGIFKASDPNERLGGTVTAGELLDKAAAQIDSGLSQDPELKTGMMHVIGRAYMYQGLYHRAQAVFEQGIRASSAAGRGESQETLNTMHDLAWAMLQQGDAPDAETLERRLIEEQTRALGASHADTLASISELAFTLCEENKCAEGVILNRDVWEKQKRVLGPEAHATLITMDNLSIMLAEDHQLKAAEKLGQQALDVHLKVFGPSNLSTINSMVNLGDFQRDLGKDESAKQTFQRALNIEERLLGPNQPETAATRYDLATVLVRSGQVDEALSLLRKSLEHGLPPRIAEQMQTDPLLLALHGDQRFSDLVAYASKRNAGESRH